MKKSSFDVNLIGLRINHHAGASGYDQIIKRMGARSIATEAQLNLIQRALASGMRRLIVNSGSTWYHRNNFITELSLANRWLRNNRQIFHFLYGENSYRYSGLLKSLKVGNYLVSTYHTPPDRFKEVVRSKKFIQRLDAVIVVSTMQQEFFSGLVGESRVFYVPHGIDTEYFKPMSLESHRDEDFHCICVGGHLRDFKTLAQAANILNKKTDKLKISVVAPPKYHDQLSKYSNIKLYSGISDEQLLALYRSADLLVLPLLDCTANNALLEGMACGLPVVSSNLLGVKDYVNDSCGLLVEPQNANALAEAVVSLVDDEISLRSMGEQSRMRSKLFDWEQVVNQLQSVYSQIAN